MRKRLKKKRLQAQAKDVFAQMSALANPEMDRDRAIKLLSPNSHTALTQIFMSSPYGFRSILQTSPAPRVPAEGTSDPPRFIWRERDVARLKMPSHVPVRGIEAGGIEP